jgi:RNA polymerase sigma-70 factor (ECF subfamily)
VDASSRTPGQNRVRSVYEADSGAERIVGLDLEGVRRRDPKALEEFFEAYFDRVFALLKRLLGDSNAAQDAAQDVFLKIHRGAHQLDPTRDPGPWVMAIATNLCRDLWRSGAYRLSSTAASFEATPGLAETLTSGGRSPEGDAIAAERARLVQEALNRLRKPLREVVVLREYEGLGYDQIASITGLNEAAVRKRYSRGLAELGKMLSKIEL